MFTLSARKERKTVAQKILQLCNRTPLRTLRRVWRNSISQNSPKMWHCHCCRTRCFSPVAYTQPGVYSSQLLSLLLFLFIPAIVPASSLGNVTTLPSQASNDDDMKLVFFFWVGIIICIVSLVCGGMYLNTARSENDEFDRAIHTRLQLHGGGRGTKVEGGAGVSLGVGPPTQGASNLKRDGTPGEGAEMNSASNLKHGEAGPPAEL